MSALILLTACGGGDGPVRWREVTLDLPTGWMVFEEGETLLSLSDSPLGQLADENAVAAAEQGATPGEQAVAIFLTYEPATTPDDWRSLIARNDGELEIDESIDVGGAPATRLVFRWDTNGVDTREMVVLVPSRQIVILAQPVPVRGETNAPEVFLEHREEFDAVVDSIRLGAPPREEGAPPPTVGRL